MMEHRILQGDVLDGLRTLPDGCVQCTVTSPPYFGLRKYIDDDAPEKQHEIGLEETPEQFKGWKPTCKCGESERVPCVVLDPFMGSGTVAVVARELNRSSIGCELNPEYVKIIRARLQADSQLDTGVVSYHFEEVTV